MILELHQSNDSSCDTIYYDKNSVRIDYKNNRNIIKKIESVAIEAWDEINTLLIWGAHGNNFSICNLTSINIRDILTKIPKKVKFDTIVLDTCESALFAKDFIDKLKLNGYILCHVGVAKGRVMQYSSESSIKISSSNIRMYWLNINKEAMKNDFFSKGLYPGICYFKEKINLDYYNSGAFEDSIEQANFTKEQLKKNIKLIKEKDIEVTVQKKDDFFKLNLP